MPSAANDTSRPPASARPLGSPRRRAIGRGAPSPFSAALRGGSRTPTSPMAAGIHPAWHCFLPAATKKHEMHQNRIGGRYARVMAADAETTWGGTALAARRMGITTRTLYKFIDAGELPAYKFGRVIRLKQSDIDAFIEAARVEPGSLEHLYPDARNETVDSE